MLDLLSEYLEIVSPSLEVIEVKFENFKITMNCSHLHRQIEKLRSMYRENTFSKVNRPDEYISKEEYLADIDKMWKDITDLINRPKILKSLIKEAPKRKADGLLCIGRVVHYTQYHNTATFRKEMKGWLLYELQIKTTTEVRAIVRLRENFST